MQVLLFLSALVISILASSEPQREVILFDKVDSDQNGALTQAELDKIFLAFDVNHDKEVTSQEFENDWTVLYNLGAPVEAHTLFNKADVNDDGHLTSADLPEIFMFFDMDGNQLVSLDEFLTQWGELKNAPVDTIVVPIMDTSSPKPATAVSSH